MEETGFITFKHMYANQRFGGPDVDPERLFSSSDALAIIICICNDPFNYLGVCLQKLSCYPVSDITRRRIQRNRR